jgi:hypothetical protein
MIATPTVPASSSGRVKQSIVRNRADDVRISSAAAGIRGPFAVDVTTPPPNQPISRAAAGSHSSISRKDSVLPGP